MMKNILSKITKYICPVFVWLLVISSPACKKNTSPGGVNPPPPPVSNDTTFTNPLLNSGPDPWVIQKDTNYYYTNTFGNRVAIYKTSKMSKLKNATLITVWSAPATGPYSKDIWAPEIHFLQNKWYIYFAADDGNNANHRIYVLENSSSDPLTGTWEFKGKIADTTNDKWAIDASEFDYNGQQYLLWSGWPGDVDGQQNIYIAKLKDPWTIEGNRVMISTPAYGWEMNGAPPAVNEGPEILKNAAGKIFLIYSASGCWTDDYALGMLSLKDGGDPLQPVTGQNLPTLYLQKIQPAGHLDRGIMGSLSHVMEKRTGLYTTRIPPPGKDVAIHAAHAFKSLHGKQMAPLILEFPQPSTLL